MIDSTAFRHCARAIILNEANQLLVFERTRRDGLAQKTHHYYSIPGGGIEEGETPEQAVVRELHEEMLVDIVPQRLIIHQIDPADQREHYYFLAHIVAGTPTFNPQSEEANRKAFSTINTYAVTWADLDDQLLAYYKSYGQAVHQVSEWLKAGSFPREPVDMIVENE